jgi:NTP pyrophosphatase (non-canonical NTP hydrolase)
VGMSNKREPIDSLAFLFERQKEFQKEVTGLELPIDSVQWYSYHTNAMAEELGELLKADKRWKTHRNAAYDPKNKLEEIADIFITAMNISMFSGFTPQEVAMMINSKIRENKEKLKNAREQDDNNS